MALAHTVSNVKWGGLDTVSIASNVPQFSDSFDVLSATVAGVAIGLSLQVDCSSSAHIRTDLIEVLSSADNVTWDTTGNAYASNSLSVPNTTPQHVTVTIPLAYAEVLRYFKVRITPAISTGSSYVYTITCNKVTV
jgi:hypothetical protein